MVGVGPGNGAALGRRFAREGYAVALLARTTATSEPLAASLADARSYSCDVTDAASVAQVFAAIGREMGSVHTLVFNAGSGTWGNVEDIDAAAFEGAFRVNALGLLLAAKQVIPAMKGQGGGNIKDKPDDFFIAPDDLADCAFHLTTQPRSAWSFEVEARPFRENW